MQQIQSTLIHKLISPRVSQDTKHPTLILLHGRGADENDLLGLAEYIDERFFIISVRAPFPFQFGGGYTWYDVLDVGSPEPKMFAESYTKLTQFLDDVRKGYSVDPEKVYLLGFSMGTIMSCAMLLTKPQFIAGVAANSGYVPENTDLKFNWNKLRGKEIFIAHGAHDPVIPVQLGRRALELFKKTDAHVAYKEYPMGHQISDESLRDMSLWLTQRLDGKD